MSDAATSAAFSVFVIFIFFPFQEAQTDSRGRSFSMVRPALRRLLGHRHGTTLRELARASRVKKLDHDTITVNHIYDLF
tara:strand:- start:5417 stop:5653 length:237 start_codon:yes stop_codon:yes gene_type:complete